MKSTPRTDAHLCALCVLCGQTFTATGPTAHIASYIKGCTFPLGLDEKNMILTEMEKHHRTKPYTIIMDITMDQKGRTHFFIPEVAKYETGFYYLHQA